MITGADVSVGWRARRLRAAVIVLPLCQPINATTFVRLGAKTPMAGPGAGAGQGVDARPSAPEVTLHAADPAFCPGSPSHRPTEPPRGLDVPVRRSRSALPGMATLVTPRAVEVVVDGAWCAIGSDGE